MNIPTSSNLNREAFKIPSSQFSVLQYFENNVPQLETSTKSIDPILFSLKDHLAQVKKDEASLITKHQTDILRWYNFSLPQIRNSLHQKLEILDEQINTKTVLP